MPGHAERSPIMMPSNDECSDMKLLARTISALSSSDGNRVSDVEIRDALTENCEQAEGPGAEALLQGRVPKALAQMVEREMLKVNRRGYLLTASGRGALLREREGPTGSEREAALARERDEARRERDEAQREGDEARRERDAWLNEATAARRDQIGWVEQATASIKRATAAINETTVDLSSSVGTRLMRRQSISRLPLVRRAESPRRMFSWLNQWRWRTGHSHANMQIGKSLKRIQFAVCCGRLN
jgi:hypothetical protein